MTQEKLWKSAVVAQTRIVYNEKELLQLMYQHLNTSYTNFTAWISSSKRSVICQDQGLPDPPSRTLNNTNAPKRAGPLTPVPILIPTEEAYLQAQTLPFPQLQPLLENLSSSLTPLQHSPRRIPLRLSSGLNTSLPSTSTALPPASPSSTAAQFSLQQLVHHFLYSIRIKCPEPKTDVFGAQQFGQRAMSYFEEEDEIFTCCNFSNDDEFIQWATSLETSLCLTSRPFITSSSRQVLVTECQSVGVVFGDGSLMLTSSGLLKPLSMLWRMGDMQEPKEQLIEFTEETFVDFGHNRSAHHLVGTLRSRATIYDTETGLAIVQLYDETLANGYERTGPVLIQMMRSSGRVVHKFDKLNPDISGCFHPKGSEVIIIVKCGT
uniref:Uncharacterized protein n=1 Tax=Ditylenchus dipsaci TaxID=166011 RepID=A0A915E119_9BILA